MAKSLLTTFFRAAFVIALAVGVRAQSPLDVIRSSNEEVQGLFAAHETLDEETVAKINSIMDRVTDFEEISRRTLTVICRDLSPAECGEFRRTFEALLRISSVKKIGRYRADRFEYAGQDVRENTAVVRTVAYYEGDAYKLDYHLERIGDRWLIVNYVMDGVDTVRNYQKQFLRLMKRESFAGVMSRLKRKIEEYEDDKT